MEGLSKASLLGGKAFLGVCESHYPPHISLFPVKLVRHSKSSKFGGNKVEKKREHQLWNLVIKVATTDE